MEANNYKRILKNAGLLYFRMLLTMAVTLYTSRVVLEALGVSDFGIYHLVGGFVTMLGFLHGAMSSATQRFLSFELGKPGSKAVNEIFSMSMNVHLLVAATLLLAGETVGLWFVTTQLTIPAERLEAAQWVYHLSLAAFLITVVSVPYHAIIIAHERMGIFAWVSLIDVALKLLIVFTLAWFGSDHLITYAALTLAVVLVVAAVYKIYCGRTFAESRFKLYWNAPLFKTLLSYTGWNIWGNAAAVLGTQGVTVILNIFFGPAVNAARAITFQVSNALNSFVQNLQVAVNPQIIKSFAAGDKASMHQLICYGAKYNFFLLLILAAPVAVEIDAILDIWLTVVPEHTGLFIRLALVTILIDSLSAPLMTAAQATGKIKLYQTVVGGLLLLNLPLSYLVLHAGYAPSAVFWVAITLSILSLIARLIIITPLVELSITQFFSVALTPAGAVAVCSCISIYVLQHYLNPPPLISIASTIALIALGVILLGVTKQERNQLVSLAKRITKQGSIKI